MVHAEEAKIQCDDTLESIRKVRAGAFSICQQHMSTSSETLRVQYIGFGNPHFFDTRPLTPFQAKLKLPKFTLIPKAFNVNIGVDTVLRLHKIGIFRPTILELALQIEFSELMQDALKGQIGLHIVQAYCWGPIAIRPTPNCHQAYTTTRTIFCNFATRPTQKCLHTHLPPGLLLIPGKKFQNSGL